MRHLRRLFRKKSFRRNVVIVGLFFIFLVVMVGTPFSAPNPLRPKIGTNGGIEMKGTRDMLLTDKLYKPDDHTTTKRMVDQGKSLFEKYVAVKGDPSECPPLFHKGPFDSNVIGKHIFKAKPIDCKRNSQRQKYLPAALKSLKMMMTGSNVQGEKCCFINLTRIDDFEVRTSSTCQPIKSELRFLKDLPVEFAQVYCHRVAYSHTENSAITVDTLAFPSPAKFTSSPQQPLLFAQNPEKLNVIIWTLSSMSRFQLYRIMPRTVDYLVSKLGALEFSRFSRVGDRFSTLMALLTKSRKMDIDECWPNRTSFFDDCPFVWKRFADEQNYLTLYAEDEPGGLFTEGKPGFNETPTDFYYRPFPMHSELAQYPCIGSELGVQKVLDFVKKFTLKASENQRNYFQFVWTKVPKLNWPLDDVVREHLEFLAEFLNNTFLIFLSAEGFPHGEFRGIAGSGAVEARNPFLFYVLPQWFLKKHARAGDNLRGNLGKLATAFDVHETLEDILSVAGLTQLEVRAREFSQVMNALGGEEEITLDSLNGMSHFLKIPRRSCYLAGISAHDCTCNYGLSHEVIVGSVVLRAAIFVVQQMNKVLLSFGVLLSKCAYLRLRSVERFQRIRPAGNFSELTSRVRRIVPVHFRLVFTIKPGNGVFEATVRKSSGHGLKVVGDVSRISAEDELSHCVANEEFKNFCVCSQRSSHLRLIGGN